jgi:tetratricopeptide (TPR) repeat protein
LEGVTELRRSSLLRAETDPATGQTRFSMLETVRAYAAEKLAAAPEAAEQLREQHARYFRHFAQARADRLRTPEEPAALSEFAASLDNVRAATDWASSNRPALGAEIALPLVVFLDRSGYQAEAMQRVEQGLAAVAAAGGPEALRGALLLEQAGLHLDRLAPEEAGRCAGEALARSEQLADARSAAQARNLLGCAAKATGRFAAARRQFRRARRQFATVGDQVGTANVLCNLGLLECEDPTGDRPAARRHLEEALDLDRARGDRRGAAEALTNLGMLAEAAEDWEAARQSYAAALGIERELRHAFGIARALSNLGEVAWRAGDAPRARPLLAAAETLFDRLGSPYRDHSARLLHEAAGGPGVPTHAVEALRRRFQDLSLEKLVEAALSAG